MLRAPAKGMTPKTDLRAERIKRRKLAKAALRSIVKGEAPKESEAVTLYLQTTKPEPASEDCADCIKIQSGLRARLIGYDPTSHRAYARIIP